LLDQLLHVAIILIICILFFHKNDVEVITSSLNMYEKINLSPLNTLLFLIVVFILATSVSGHIIKHIVGSMPSKLANFEGELTLSNHMIGAKEKSQPKIENSFTEEYHYFTYSSSLRSHGRLIGYIERLLVI